MSRTHIRVPRVQRLEYLIAFLNSYKNVEFDEEQAQKAIQQQIHDFEIRKAKALGRQRPRIHKGTNTLQECVYLAMQLGLIDRFKRRTPDAARVLEPDQRRHLLLERMWQAYPRFRQVVLTARDAKQLDLPFHSWDTLRQEGSDLYDLKLDRLNFEAIRDLATQLDLINWHPTKENRQIVYPVASVATFSEMFSLTGQPIEDETFAQQCRHQTALDINLLALRDGRYESRSYAELKAQGYLVLQTGSDQVFIKDHSVVSEDFEQALWQEYLSLSNMRPRFPVLYPNLRNQVCAALYISDRVFDQHLLSLVRQPQRLTIYPSGGILNYAANLAHLGKFLPPQTSQGNFVIYLKIDRRDAS